MARKRDDIPDDARDFEAELNGKQKQALGRARKMLEAPASDLTWHHDLGARFAVLAAGSFYGENRVDRLARALDLSRITVYQHIQLHERYPSREEVAALGSAGLGWAMVVALLGVEDPAERARLQAEAVARRGSVDRLRLEVRRARQQGGARPRRRGRNGDNTGLARLDDATVAWLVAHGEVWADDGEACAEGGAALLERLGQALRGP